MLMAKYRNPVPTVDIIILLEDEHGNIRSDEIILIKRKKPPYGWALPGGFVDYGETLEQAAVREAKEETSLDVTLLKQFHTYSDPSRDPRQHTITTVYVAKAKGIPRAQDDAQEIGIFNVNELPQPIAFDHASIIEDFKHNTY